MRTTRSLPLTISITLALTTAMPQALPATADATDHGSNFEQAMEAYSDGQFDIAEAKLQLAAAQGHASAHEILGFMYAIGPRLYRGIARDRQKAAAHLAVAAARGSLPARYMQCVITRDAPMASAAPAALARCGRPR